ncbi:MAG: phospholipase D-like domain-containing protein [Desulfobulbus sp.]|nr:phospholipase D-like domain-containing protein [Desulfobulbus sp.]
MQSLRRTVRNRFPLPRRISFLKRLSGVACLHHNKVTLLPHGGDFFPALFQAVAKAVTAICAEFYIIRADKTGEAFAQALQEAAVRGVEVSLVYDAIGCFDTPVSYFQRLQAAGVHCLPSNKPALSRLRWLDLRNHRKMVIVDGTTAFLGGLNIGDEYAGYGDSYEHWRDVGIRLNGPVAGELQRLFRHGWLQEGGAGTPGQHVPQPWSAGDSDVIIINGSPHYNRSLIHNAFRLAMAGTSHRIQIITPYFLPGPKVIRSLLRAVERGTQVQMILPSISARLSFK